MANDAWDQLPDESEQAYLAFKTYLEMLPVRSIVGAYRLYSGKPEAEQAPGGFSAWAKDFKWDARARAYAAHMNRIRALELAEQERAKVRARAQLQEELREEYAKLSKQMREKSAAILTLPVVDTHLKDGKTIVKAARASEFNASCRLGTDSLDMLERTGLLDREHGRSTTTSVPTLIINIDAKPEDEDEE